MSRRGRKPLTLAQDQAAGGRYTAATLMPRLYALSLRAGRSLIRSPNRLASALLDVELYPDHLVWSTAEGALGWLSRAQDWLQCPRCGRRVRHLLFAAEAFACRSCRLRPALPPLPGPALAAAEALRRPFRVEGIGGYVRPIGFAAGLHRRRLAYADKLEAAALAHPLYQPGCELPPPPPLSDEDRAWSYGAKVAAHIADIEIVFGVRLRGRL